MAPGKVASAGEDDQCPSLKLIMEKGPLSGRTNDFRPGARVQIGRVIRGNTISIKDRGISTNHLLIQVEPVTGGLRRWTVTDLVSSNGTFLNDERLEPSEPAALSDGDVIKIGEQTSIKVGLEVNAGVTEVNSRNVRRNARRGVKKQVEELGVINEDSELGLEIKNLESENNLGPGIGNEKYMDLGNDSGKLGIIDEEKVRGRRTRGSKAKELENGSKGGLDSTGKLSLRGPLSAKKDKSSENLVMDEDDEKNDKLAEVEVKQGRNMAARRTRSAKNNEKLSKDLNLDVNKELEQIGVKGNERVSVRRTRSSRKEGNIDDPLIDLSVIEGKRTRKGTRGRKNIHTETTLDEKEKEESNLEEQEVREEEKIISEDRNGSDERESCEREDASAFASTPGVKESTVEDGNGKVVVDLEKMTLGGWFDFLEVYLPKQIIDETEEMIYEMRKKAERLHEFMLQQKIDKEKGDVAMDEKSD